MKSFGLLGEKLGHSLSPQIHNLIFQELKLEGKYDLLEVPKSRLSTLISVLPQNYGGVNVTIPYKVEVMEYLSSLSKEAEDIGAVNTICFKAGEAIGYNTDYLGFNKLLEHNGIAIKNKKVAVMGTGGAARAVLQYAADKKAKEILIVSRKPDEAAWHLEKFAKMPNTRFLDYDNLKEDGLGDVLINATPVGMYPKDGVSPAGPSIVGNYKAVVDLIYNPKETVLMHYAKEAGRLTCNGFYMLIAQAVAAEEIWLNTKIPNSVIEKIVKKLG